MCDDANTYCCGTGPIGSYDRAPNDTCCSIPELVFKAESAYPFTSLSVNPSSTSIVLSGSSSGPASATATTTDNPNTASASNTTLGPNSTSSHHSNTYSIAIGVVVAIATVSLAALCYMLWKIRRQKAQVAAATQPQESYQEHPKAIPELGAKIDNTLLSPREMSTTYEAHELYGDVVNPVASVESPKQTSDVHEVDKRVLKNTLEIDDQSLKAET